MKVVIHPGLGGFGLKTAAIIKLHEQDSKWIRVATPRHELQKEAWRSSGIPEVDGKFLMLDDEDNLAFRSDPQVVALVEAMGETNTELRVIEIPDDIDVEIVEYDGAEHIAEKHRTWGEEL